MRELIKLVLLLLCLGHVNRLSVRTEKCRNPTLPSQQASRFTQAYTLTLILTSLLTSSPSIQPDPHPHLTPHTLPKHSPLPSSSPPHPLPPPHLSTCASNQPCFHFTDTRLLTSCLGVWVATRREKLTWASDMGAMSPARGACTDAPSTGVLTRAPPSSTRSNCARRAARRPCQ